MLIFWLTHRYIYYSVIINAFIFVCFGESRPSNVCFFYPICIYFLPIMIHKLATRNTSHPLSPSSSLHFHRCQNSSVWGTFFFLPTIHCITCEATDSGHRDPSNQPRCCCCCCCTVKTPAGGSSPPQTAGTHISLHACLPVNWIHLMSLGFLGPEAMCIQGLCSGTTRRGPTMAVLCFPFISASAACRLLPKQMSVKETWKNHQRFCFGSLFCFFTSLGFSGGLPSVFPLLLYYSFFFRCWLSST